MRAILAPTGYFCFGAGVGGLAVYATVSMSFYSMMKEADLAFKTEDPSDGLVRGSDLHLHDSYYLSPAPLTTDVLIGSLGLGVACLITSWRVEKRRR